MIRCHICGEDASTGWIQGFAPGSDIHKMGLCAKHDTTENRQFVLSMWQSFMEKEIAATIVLGATKQLLPQRWILEIEFFSGSSRVEECIECLSVNDSLQVILPDKSFRFYPLSGVKSYLLRPVTGPAANVKFTPASTSSPVKTMAPAQSAPEIKIGTPKKEALAAKQTTAPLSMQESTGKTPITLTKKYPSLQKEEE